MANNRVGGKTPPVNFENIQGGRIMVKDIIIDDFGDLVFSNGDLKVGDSDPQHAVLLVNTMAGSWKQYPTAGVGIIQYLGSSGQDANLKRVITVQMEADGFSNVDVTVIDSGGGNYNYDINANRNV